jgi:hypothetical protein
MPFVCRAHIFELLQETMTRFKGCRNDGEDGPPQAQRVRIDGISMAVYPIVWSFLLHSGGTSEERCIDYKNIASFMLVSRASKEAFDRCRGWWHCAQALKREGDSKLMLIRAFEERGSHLVQRMPDVFSPNYHTWRLEMNLWVEETITMQTVDSHILIIQSTLRRLAVLYDGDRVNMEPYESALMHTLSRAMMGSSLRMLEAIRR